MSVIVHPLMRAVGLLNSVAMNTIAKTPYEQRMVTQMREDRNVLREFAQQNCSHPSGHRVYLEDHPFDECTLCDSTKVPK
jgi:hypothetical protein